MNLFKNKRKLKEGQVYYLLYSACFLVTALIVFSWYFLKGKTLVWTVDGWGQHYKALVYYAQYMRDIIKNIVIRHELIIPKWDFSFGEGGDILQILQYYVMGDPFSLGSILIPTRFMYLYYTGAVLLRLYLSGIAFSTLCFQTGNKNRYAVLAGSMTYDFCFWAIAMAGQHPFFLNPMLYLPLLILGVEKIIQGKRPYLFILTVAISAMSNFYFFYVLVFIVVIYVLVRVALLYHKEIKKALGMIIRIGISSVLGLLISAMIFLPVCYAFLVDARGSAGQSFHLFYPLIYYLKLPAAFLTNAVSYQLYMGFAVPVLLAVFLMFYRKKEYTLTKVFFIICIVFSIFPFCGQILNGFSYMSNRWCFAFALLLSYILTIMWTDLIHLKVKEAKFLVICTTMYFFLCLIFEFSRTKQAFAAIALCMVLLFILIPVSGEEFFFSQKRKQQLIVLTILVSAILNSFWKNSTSEGNSADGMSRHLSDALTANETAAVSSAANLDEVDEFYRFSGRDLTANANMIAGISSTQYYWTLSNPNTAEYRSKLNVLENTAFRYEGYDDRTAPNSLSSVLYYSVPAGDSAPAPYGFTFIDADEIPSNYKIYRNEYALPIAYTYENYILNDTWESLSATEKQEAMLQNVVLSTPSSHITTGGINLISVAPAYTVTCNSDEITKQGNTFVVTSAGSTATITFEGLPDSETYFEIKGLDFQSASKYDLYFGNEKFDPLSLYDESRWNLLSKSSQELIKKERFFWSAPTAVDLTFKSSNNVSKVLRYYTKDHSYYANRHDFIVNYGYAEEPLTSIEISFPECGIYAFDSVGVICQPMEHYAEQIEALKKDSLQNVVFGTDTITGEITLETPKILCFSIPYSTGWSAYVDGREADLYQANTMHMALELDKGTHIIKLTYETPLLKAGIYLSLFGVVILILFIIINEKNIRNNGNSGFDN